MALAQLDWIGGGGVSTTEFMKFYSNPYGNSLPKFMVCTKGYSKIGIQPLADNDRNGVSIYTATHTPPSDISDILPTSWGDSLIGSAPYSGTPETQIDVSAYDYVWVSYTVVGASYGRLMQYRLIA